MADAATARAALTCLNFEFAVDNARNLILFDCFSDTPDHLLLSFSELSSFTDQRP